MLLDNVIVTKVTGEKTAFSEEKLAISLKNAGANDAAVQRVLERLEALDISGFTTKKIYSEAFRILKKEGKSIAARYNLKRAMMELGPSGYPFERYIAEILNYQGYETAVGVMVQGNCLEHEVDVVARKGNDKIMVECKYHNSPSKKSDVQVPMYIYARFLDITKKWKREDKEEMNYKCWIATNTRFSTDAIKYGHCVGLKMLSWDQPSIGNLKERIEISGLYPVTCLTTLTKAQKKGLLKMGLVLAKSLLGKEETLRDLYISNRKINKVLQEVRELCEVES